MSSTPSQIGTAAAAYIAAHNDILAFLRDYDKTDPAQVAVRAQIVQLGDVMQRAKKLNRMDKEGAIALAAVMSSDGGGGGFEIVDGFMVAENGDEDPWISPFGTPNINSITTRSLKFGGQITVVNGSPIVVGVGATSFLDSTEGGFGLGWAYGCWIVDSAGAAFFCEMASFEDATHGTIGYISHVAWDQYGLKAGNLGPNFPGVSGTYDFYYTLSRTHASGGSALGSDTVVGTGGNASNAVGGGCVANGYLSASVGNGCLVGAGANGAAAVGVFCWATGQDSYAAGNLTKASAFGAVAIGRGFDNDVANSVAFGGGGTPGVRDGSAWVRASSKRMEVLGAAGDVVLASDDGSRFKITVSDLGVLVVTEL